jgi:hypothetical protein
VNAQEIREWLVEAFSEYLYPSVVLAVCASIVLLLIVIVSSARTASGRVRAATGALLPFVVLIFAYGMKSEAIQDVASLVRGLPPTLAALIGAGGGAVLMAAGKRLLETDSEGAAGLYALFTASLGASLLWAFMGGIIASLDPILLGGVIGSGLHVIVRGLPGQGHPRKAAIDTGRGSG